MRKILATTDGTSYSIKACQTAYRLARNAPGCKLVILNVAPFSVMDVVHDRASMSGEPVMSPEKRAELLEFSQNVLDTTLSQLHGRDIPVEPRSVLGHPAQTIVEIAEKEEFDLVVVGCKGHSKLAKILLGSVSDYVVGHCICPVMVVKDTPEE
jgi:nucleotide-binding universal stress UspA family protein